MKALIFACIVFTAPVCAFARIGETYDELVKRYGPPVRQGPDAPDPGLPKNVQQKYFKFQNWTIETYLLDGRCAYASYSQERPIDEAAARKNPQGLNPVRGELYQSAIDLVLGANSRGKQWKTVAEIEYQGRKRRVGSYQSPHNLINAWILDGEPIMCVHERFVSGDGTHVDYIRLFSTEWNEFVGAITRKEQQEQIKKSGL